MQILLQVFWSFWLIRDTKYQNLIIYIDLTEAQF